MTALRSIQTVLVVSVLGAPGAALAQQSMGPAGGDKAIPHLAPRNPGGAGVTGGHQKRATETVEGIDRHLLQEEKTRPRLPNQAPSPSQRVPGGTANGAPSGMTPPTTPPG